jgi:hypothetical protein
MRDDPRLPRAGSRGRHDDRLDALIDRVVREMMDVDPRPGMRERVRARLEAASSRKWTLTFPRLVLAGGVVALMLVAFISKSTRPASDDATTITSEARPGGSAPASAAPPKQAANTPIPQVEPQRSADRTERRRPAAPPHKPELAASQAQRLVRAASIDAASLDAAPPEVAAAVAPAVEIAPVTDIDPIRIARLSQTPIVPSEIRIAPLAMDQIEVAPLTLPR